MKSIVRALDKTRYRKPGIDCLARAFGEAVDQNQSLIFWSDFNLPSGRQVWFWWSSHLIVILVVEVLHEDATGEPFDPPLHPHLVLVKVLVADVVLCCRLRETSCFYHFFSHYTQLSRFFALVVALEALYICPWPCFSSSIRHITIGFLEILLGCLIHSANCKFDQIQRSEEWSTIIDRG